MTKSLEFSGNCCNFRVRRAGYAFLRTGPIKKDLDIWIIFRIFVLSISIFMRVTNKRLGMKFDCVKLLNWAEELLGPSKCKSIAFTWDSEEESLGWYNWDETIWINLASCKRMISVQKTILHEWTHAQQTFRWYNHYQMKYGYKNNPYEIQARDNEKLVKRAYKKRK